MKLKTNLRLRTELKMQQWKWEQKQKWNRNRKRNTGLKLENVMETEYENGNGNWKRKWEWKLKMNQQWRTEMEIEAQNGIAIGKWKLENKNAKLCSTWTVPYNVNSVPGTVNSKNKNPTLWSGPWTVTAMVFLQIHLSPKTPRFKSDLGPKIIETKTGPNC